MVWPGVRPAAGEPIPEMVSAPDIAPDADPGEYNSDPPTSGLHYAAEAEPGFYCDLVSETECSVLKSQIRTVMDELGGTKLIAYPWPSLNVPVVVTSWTLLQKFQTFDAGQAKAFYRANLNRAPEPNAQ